MSIQTVPQSTPQSPPRHSASITADSRERGSILLMAVVFTLIVTISVAALVTTTLQQSRTANSSIDHTGAMALAEGVTESAQKTMLTEVANFQEPTLEGVVTLGGVEYDYTIATAGEQFSRTDDDGVTMVIQPYTIDAEATIDQSTSRITRIVELTMTPIFQYMIFYDSDLEILPGPSMTLGGRVHTNGSMYLGTGNTLTVDTQYFRATGGIYRERKDSGSTTGGTVNIQVQGSTDYVEMENDMDSENSDWLALAMDTWNGTVQSGAHGVSEVGSPEIATIKAYDENGNPGYYHENAGLVIIDGVAYDGDGDEVTLPAGAVTEVSMYDGREGQYVTVTEIDVDLLNDSSHFPENGLVYAYRTDSNSDDPNGVRLTNGSELSAPLTLVSEGPVYIQGDYNTVDKKGAAVIADAVNLLSNSWDDSKTPGSLPSASDTWYNVAMVTGNVPTPDGGGAYSGGFENLPRFHESWSGRTASIRGAFINLYESEIADSPWFYGGDSYRAPRRDWLFDPDLNDIDNMPPFTPSAVYFRRVTWDDNVPVPFAAVVEEAD